MRRPSKTLVSLTVMWMCLIGGLPIQAAAQELKAQVTFYARTNSPEMAPVRNATINVLNAGRAVVSVTTDDKGEAMVYLPATPQKDSSGEEQYQLYDLMIQARGYKAMNMINIPAMYDNPIFVDIPLSRGVGKSTYQNPPPKMRPGIKYIAATPGIPNKPDSATGPQPNPDISPLALCLNDWYQKTYTYTRPDPAVNEYVYENTEALIKKSLTREFAGPTPQGSWHQESLKAGAIAIRSWILYFSDYKPKPSRYYNGVPYIMNSQADLTWYSYWSQAAYNAANAVPYRYVQFGALADGTCKPASTYFSGIVTSRESAYGAGYSKDQRSDDEYKPYLASIYDEADYTNNLGESYSSVQYLPAPGLSQQGANTWAHGFSDHTGTQQASLTSSQILYHYYTSVSIRTVNHF